MVDDDSAFMAGVARYLRTVGIETRPYTSPSQFLEHAEEESQTPGCLLLDVAMPEMDGITLFKLLCNRGIRLPVVFMTGHADVPRCIEAFKSGALDFLLKPIQPSELQSAVEGAFAEDQRRREDDAYQFSIQERFARLSQREFEVGEFVARGFRNQDIASALHISEKTVKAHRGKVMHKLEAESLADLVLLWEAHSPRPQ